MGTLRKRGKVEAKATAAPEDVDLLQVMVRAMNSRRIHIDTQDDNEADDWDM